MAKISEVFGDLDNFKDRGEFVLMPHGTFVLAEITAVKGKEGACMVESVTKRVQAGLDGNYGSPKFWDHLNFITPKGPDPTGTEEEIKKANMKGGMWARRVKALGIDVKDMDLDDFHNFTPEEYQDFYAPTIGRTVIIKTRLEAASGEYRAKNTASDYIPDTPKNRAKYGLADAEVTL